MKSLHLGGRQSARPFALAAAALLIGLCANATAAGDSESAPALFLIRQNGKFGYIDAKGKIAIEPTFLIADFDRGPYFSEGLQAASEEMNVGYIDASGKMVIKPQFGLALPFSEGLAAVRASENPWKWGFIDKTGSYKIPPQFDEADGFSEGLARVVLEGRSKYIDKSGAVIIEPKPSSHSSPSSTFSEGLACVNIDGRWGFIDKQGKLVIEATLEQPTSFREGLAAVQVKENGSSKYGYIDKSGKFAIEPKFSLAWPFSEGLARVQEGGTMAFIDRTGEVIFRVPEGRWADEFSEGLVNVRVGPSNKGNWGYVDRSGKWVIEPVYRSAKPFSNGLAMVVVGTKMAYINKSGQYVWGPDSGNEALTTKIEAQAAPAATATYYEELIRLAKFVDPQNPPLTAQSLDSPTDSPGVPIEKLQKLAAEGSDPARQLLEKLLSYPPNPDLVKLSPEWAAMQQADMQETVAKALAAIGDPFVVPTLRTWLSEALKGEGELEFPLRTKTRSAVEGLMRFRDKSSSAQMEQLLKTRTLDQWIRSSTLEAIAVLGEPQSQPILLEALKDETIEEPIRCKIAAGLVRMGVPAGRDYLLARYDVQLDSLRGKSSDSSSARSELEWLGDSELITKLRAKADAEPAGIPKNNLGTLLDAMEVSAMPVEKLKEMATTGGPRKSVVIGVLSNTDLRLHAIAVLGRDGDLSVIPFLEALQAAPRSERDDLVRSAAALAIRKIRMRNW